MTHELKHQNSKELRVLRERIYREDFVHQVLFQVLQQKALQAAVAWKKSRYQTESGEHQDLTNRDSQKCLAGVLRNKRGCYHHANQQADFIPSDLSQENQKEKNAFKDGNP